MKVRRAGIDDLATLIHFTAAEATDAESLAPATEVLARGIRFALEDERVARYWLLVDDSGAPAGSVSSVQEWSDWNAGYYWWIQSMYIAPAFRGRDCMQWLLKAVETEMIKEGGLELRLYVHEDNLRAIRAYEKADFEPSPYKIMALARNASIGDRSE